MHCIVINLDAHPERYRSVESNFFQAESSDWKLTRLSAVNATQIAEMAVKGRLRPAEKGCFVSHILAIQASRDIAAHTLIVEDDVLFGTQSLKAIETAIGLASGCDWDILFTDICVPDATAMLEMFKLRRKLNRGSDVRLLPLDRIPFAGSTAYLVNARSKDKLLTLLCEADNLDVPYDLTLRQLVQSKRIKGYVVFPFATSLSGFADQSQIQLPDESRVADISWNAFRRLVWLEGSAQSASADVNGIDESYFDPDCTVFSKILSCMLSAHFVAK